MREILFRGKKKTDGNWITGSLLKLFYHNGSISYEIVLLGDDRGYEVIPETIGQYTELKDKNGEKIFEGDFVTFHTEYEMPDDDVWYEKEPYLVKWDNEIAGFEPFYLNGRWRCNIVNLKIIGNKWDNPELLEEKR